MTQASVKITLSATRAKAVNQALILADKLATGQLEHLSYLQKHSVIPVKKRDDEVISDNQANRTAEAFNEHVAALKDALGYLDETLPKGSANIPLHSKCNFEVTPLLSECLRYMSEAWDYNSDNKNHLRYAPADLAEPVVATTKDGKFVELTLSITHAKALSEALEIYSRIGIGQITEIFSMFKMGQIQRYSDSLKLHVYPYNAEFNHNIETTVSLMRACLGFASGESLGIGNRGVCKSVHLAWETKKVLDKEIAMFVDPNPKFRGVNYDGLIVRYTNDLIPEVAIS